MLYREIIAVCSQTHTKHTNTVCVSRTWKSVNVSPGGSVHTATWLLVLIQTNWRLRTCRMTYYYFIMSSIRYYNYEREFIGLLVEQPIPRTQADILPEQSF